jgi:hypothetical protein
MPRRAAGWSAAATGGFPAAHGPLAWPGPDATALPERAGQRTPRHVRARCTPWSVPDAPGLSQWCPRRPRCPVAGPCALLPGVGELAARPGMTHAMTPVTGSFISDQAAHAVAGHEGQITVGENSPWGSRRPLAVTFAGTADVRETKNPDPATHPQISRVQPPGSGATTKILLFLGSPAQRVHAAVTFAGPDLDPGVAAGEAALVVVGRRAAGYGWQRVSAASACRFRPLHAGFPEVPWPPRLLRPLPG